MQKYFSVRFCGIVRPVYLLIFKDLLIFYLLKANFQVSAIAEFNNFKIITFCVSHKIITTHKMHCHTKTYG